MGAGEGMTAAVDAARSSLLTVSREMATAIGVPDATVDRLLRVGALMEAGGRAKNTIRALRSDLAMWRRCFISGSIGVRRALRPIISDARGGWNDDGTIRKCTQDRDGAALRRVDLCAASSGKAE